MLYLGYVGFSVPFAFAIAALVTGRVGEGWLLETRRWTLFAWGFLTIGIVLGAWWSYEVLGWGGVWAWDPVENASLLPWLTGTAYIHSVLVQERRGMLRVWNLSLLCATFSLTILGTFLTRSGVLDSVHSFSESDIGVYLLTFFALTVGVSIALIGWRGDRLRSPGSIDSPLSREGAFLANNVLFAVFAFVVLLGTVFPLVIEAVQDRRISVGPALLRQDGHADRAGAAVPDGGGAGAAVAQGVDRAAAPAPVLAGVVRRRAPSCWPSSSAPTASPRCSPSASVASPPAPPGASSCWPPGARAGGACVGRANGGMIVHIGVVMIAVALGVDAGVHEPVRHRQHQARARRPAPAATRSPTRAPAPSTAPPRST